jgi:hypothetical protein
MSETHNVVSPAERVRTDAALAELGRRVWLTDDDVAAIGWARDGALAEPRRQQGYESSS